MVIREMDRKECLSVLAKTRWARLACARDNQPYIVPVTLVYHSPEDGEPCLYGVNIPGQKVEWMQANPMVCVEVDKVEADDLWVSVIVFGRYEELLGAQEHHPHFPARSEIAEKSGGTAPEASGHGDERMLAFQLLSTQRTWWEVGWASWKARAHDDPTEECKSIYYKIWIDRITGHEATRGDKRPSVPGSAPT